PTACRSACSWWGRGTATAACCGPRGGWRSRWRSRPSPSGPSPSGSSPCPLPGGKRESTSLKGRDEGAGGYTGRAMIVLGITETHCATAALLRDGRIVGCASEERFSRLKNEAGYPRRAIDALLRECDVRPEQIDLVALAGSRAASREWLNRVQHDEDYAREYYGVAWPSRRRALERRVRKWGARFGLIDASRGKFGITPRERLAAVTDHLGVRADRIVSLDHHTCHAAAAYWGSGFGGRSALVLTNDNSGDGLCATASTGSGLTLTRHEASPSAPGSVGAFYSFATLALGMK